jgi:predicted nuclease of predicted toxin-antitoxin system
MRVLLDECVTRYLKRDFTNHEVLTVEEAGFKGLKNSRLLQAASGQYDVLVTVDQNLEYQQNLKTFALAIIVLKAKRSTYPMLKPLMSQVLEAIEKINPGEILILV